MADFNNSPNMSLPIPAVGVAPGPDWATLLNSCLTIVDQHSHVAGSGVPITPDALDINDDLSLSSNNLIAARSVRLVAQGSPLALASDLGCVYVSGADLYYNDISGNQVRITQSGAVAGTPGSIANLVSPASASYVAGNSTFVWQSAANTPAKMDSAALVLRNLSAGSFSLTLQPPAAMSVDTTVTLPNLPASSSFMQMSSSGVISVANAVVDVLMPAGSIIAYGGFSAPAGRWLLCDGSAISRTTYANLFSAIGVAYGEGDASTTFNLPDLRGRFIRGVDNGAGHDPDAASRSPSNTGGNGGDNVGSYQGSGIVGHTHSGSVPIPVDISVGSSGTGKLVQGQATTFFTPSFGFTTNATGGNETRPVNVYANYLIKY